MGVVEDIVAQLKSLVAGYLTEYKPLRYEYDISQNPDRDYKKRFGVTSEAISFSDGASLGFVTVDHDFKILLTHTYSNRDNDNDKNAKLMELYEAAHLLMCKLNKSRLATNSQEYQVMLINTFSVDTPEILGDNKAIILALNITVKYKYRDH